MAVYTTTISRVTGGIGPAMDRTLRVLHALGPDSMVSGLGYTGNGIIREWRANIDGGRSAYHRFPKLSPGYEERKRRRYGSKPILRRTDDLYNSFTWDVNVLGSGRYELLVRAPGRDSVNPRVTNIQKAVYAIEGTAGGRRRGSIAPQNTAQVIGTQRRTSGTFRVWRRPPRVFTTLKRGAVGKMLRDAMVREIHRSSGRPPVP